MRHSTRSFLYPCLTVPAFQVPSSIEKVAEVDFHIGCAMSGLTADARTLIDHGRVEAQVLACDYRYSRIAESDGLSLLNTRLNMLACLH